MKHLKAIIWGLVIVVLLLSCLFAYIERDYISSRFQGFVIEKLSKSSGFDIYAEKFYYHDSKLTFEGIIGKFQFLGNGDILVRRIDVEFDWTQFSFIHPLKVIERFVIQSPLILLDRTVKVAEGQGSGLSKMPAPIEIRDGRITMNSLQNESLSAYNIKLFGQPTEAGLMMFLSGSFSDTSQFRAIGLMDSLVILTKNAPARELIYTAAPHFRENLNITTGVINGSMLIQKHLFLDAIITNAKFEVKDVGDFIADSLKFIGRDDSLVMEFYDGTMHHSEPWRNLDKLQGSLLFKDNALYITEIEGNWPTGLRLKGTIAFNWNVKDQQISFSISADDWQHTDLPEDFRALLPEHYGQSIRITNGKGPYPLEMDLEITEGTWQGLNFPYASIHYSQDSSGTYLSPIEGQLWDGSIKGSLKLVKGTYELNADLIDGDIPELLGFLDIDLPITGRGNASGFLTGDSVLQLVDCKIFCQKINLQGLNLDTLDGWLSYKKNQGLKLQAIGVKGNVEINTNQDLMDGKISAKSTTINNIEGYWNGDIAFSGKSDSVNTFIDAAWFAKDYNRGIKFQGLLLTRDTSLMIKGVTKYKPWYDSSFVVQCSTLINNQKYVFDDLQIPGIGSLKGQVVLDSTWLHGQVNAEGVSLDFVGNYFPIPPEVTGIVKLNSSINCDVKQLVVVGSLSSDSIYLYEKPIGSASGKWSWEPNRWEVTQFALSPRNGGKINFSGWIADTNFLADLNFSDINLNSVFEQVNTDISGSGNWTGNRFNKWKGEVEVNLGSGNINKLNYAIGWIKSAWDQDSIHINEVSIQSPDNYEIRSSCDIPIELIQIAHNPALLKSDVRISAGVTGDVLKIISQIAGWEFDAKGSGELFFQFGGKPPDWHLDWLDFNIHEGSIVLPTKDEFRINRLAVEVEESRLRNFDFQGDIETAPVIFRFRDYLKPGEEALNFLGVKLGVAELLTTDAGIPILFSMLSDRKEPTYIQLQGLGDEQALIISGPWQEPVVKGQIEVTDLTIAQLGQMQTTGSFNPFWNVRVKVGANVWFRNEEIQLLLNKGDFVDILGAAPEMIVNGKLNSSKGTIRFLERDFRLLDAQIEFPKNSKVPLVSANAEYVTQEERIEQDRITSRPFTISLEVRGFKDQDINDLGKSVSMDEMLVKLSSNNPIYNSEEQIMSLLGYGSSSTQQAVVDLGSRLLRMSLLAPIEREVASLLQVDWITIRPGFIVRSILGSNAFGDTSLISLSEPFYRTDTELSVGKYLGRNVYLSYRAALLEDYLDSDDEKFHFENSLLLEWKFSGDLSFRYNFNYRTLPYLDEQSKYEQGLLFFKHIRF